MKTVLIAEDEKLIRKGLIAMVRRAPIDVEEIIEARNGEQALEVLRDRKADLVITDIRMPGMDGIELVKRINQMEDTPFVLVISGYDDFSYAVEMLRSGVQNYLLKPVERESFYSSLQKIDQLVKEKEEQTRNQDKDFRHAIRSIMLQDAANGETMDGEIERYEAMFPQGAYRVICSRSKELEEGNVLWLKGRRKLGAAVCPADTSGFAAQIEHNSVPSGSSQIHCGLAELPYAYQEAEREWKKAFFLPISVKSPKATAERLSGDAKEKMVFRMDQMVRKIGMGNWNEPLQELRRYEESVQMGFLEPDEFADTAGAFMECLNSTYPNEILPKDAWMIQAVCWDFSDAEEYFQKAEEWLREFSERIQSRFDDYENRQKIELAVEYMKENFRTQLNMAVVSNEVSMNYSLFSLAFKQYTGMNFVNYLQNLRIEEAKKLLADTQWYVNEIGMRCGFQDDKHFLKVFKASEGVTPTQWRKTEMQRK